MTEPSAQRPVPGPPRPGPSPTPAPAAAQPSTESGEAPDSRDVRSDQLTNLDQVPVGEHVAVFEAEHERLQRQLGTIDPL